MAGYRVNNYDTSTADITSLMETIDATRTGYIALSLTEYDSTARPEIAGGSLVEVCGALFRFSTTESISTTGVTSTAAQMYYIKLVPTSSQCSAQFSTTASAWREDLQGYYHSTISNNRVIGATYFTGADYLSKAIYESQGVQRFFVTSGYTTFTTSTTTAAESTITVNFDGITTSIQSVIFSGAYISDIAIMSLSLYSTYATIVIRAYVSYFASPIEHSVFISGTRS